MMKNQIKFNDVSKYSNEEICEMIYNLNIWKWDDRVGDKPDGFDQMPLYNRHWWHKLMRRETRIDYINPAMSYLQKRVSMREFYFFANVTRSKRMTSEEFEKWWEKEKDFLWFAFYHCYQKGDESYHRSNRIWY